jgi:hypothetical protein
MKYSIDTSALMDGWTRYYPPDVAPSLWENLAKLIIEGALRATEEVYLEIKRKDDELFAWVKQQPDLIEPINGTIQQHVRTILEQYPKLIDTRNNRSGADPFVIALAMENSCTVVTGELPTFKPHRPNIPDVCTGFNVDYMNIVTLMRTEEMVLGNP